MPARKARGAIVEKGEKRRKVIGDYLNSAESRQIDRFHAPRGNAALDAPRPLEKLTRSVTRGIPTRSVGTIKPGLFLGFSLHATLALGFEQADARCD